MALTASGQVRYTLKTPYRDGTTHIVLEPLDLMARLAALVSPPRVHAVQTAVNTQGRDVIPLAAEAAGWAGLRLACGRGTQGRDLPVRAG